MSSFFNQARYSYARNLERKFLREKKPKHTTKVLTGWRSGDIFVGKRKAGDAVELDLDLLMRGDRKWGAGNGYGEGYANFDPIEVEAFWRSALKKGHAIKDFELNVTEDDSRSVISEEAAVERSIFWERGNCVYPFCCFRMSHRKALCVWIFQIVLALAFFAAAIYVSLIDIRLANFPAWSYFVFAGVFLIVPGISTLLVSALYKTFVYLVKTMRDREHPENAEPMLSLLYLNKKASSDLMLFFTFFLYTISFLLIFANHPTNTVAWVNGYRYTSAVLGTLTVWSLGGVFSQYLTHTVTKEVNVHSLGSKVRSVLRAEKALWRLVEVEPDQSENELFEIMEDPYLTYDPQLASDLARKLVKTPMAGIYKTKYTRGMIQRIPIKVESDIEASLLGSWCYACMMQGSVKSAFKAPVYQPKTLIQWKSSSASLTHMDAIIDDYYSTSQTRLAKFKQVHRRALEKYDFTSADSGFGTAYKVYEHLDLAVPLDFFREWVDIASEEEPWSKNGVVRGIPKKYITKHDFVLALRAIKPVDVHRVKSHREISSRRLSIANVPCLPTKSTKTKPEGDDDIILEDNVSPDHAWDFLDPEHSGKITLKRCKNAVSGLVQDRMNLKTTLENTAQVVRKLRSVISTGINFFVFLCALAIFGLDVLEVWVGISSIVLAFSFVFGGTLKGVFDSVVFLFGVHPYDVGDKIKLGPTEDVYWIKRISLMSTQMSRWDGSSVRFMNQYLFNVFPLINVRRSGNHERTISFFIDAATLPTKSELERMQFEFEQFLSWYPGSYSGSCSVTARDIVQPLHVKITIWWAFAYPDIDSGRTFRDTSRVIQFLISTFKKRNIKVSAVNSGSLDLEKGNASTKKQTNVGLQGVPGTTRII